MNILYISMMMPHKNAGNAGAKTFWYYLSNIASNTENNVYLIAKRLPGENISEDLSNVTLYSVENQMPKINHPLMLLKEINSKINPFHKLGNTLRFSVYNEIIKRLDELPVTPEVVVLEFTQMLYLVDEIKSRFSTAKLVSSEHDVSYLRVKREYESKRGIIRMLWKKIYHKMKCDEISALHKCDVIMTHNKKDKQLLIDDGIICDTIHVIVPYYQNITLHRAPDNSTLLFYGAMGRSENYESAMWFIEKVMPLLKKVNVRLLIVGGNPPAKLKKLANENISVLGFVNDLEAIFTTCMCMVAPLHFGAGIKIKVLEAMAAGIPVLTTEIGIEGINANDGEDFILCNTPEEYKNAICRLKQNSIIGERIADSSIKFIHDEFDLELSLSQYIRKLEE